MTSNTPADSLVAATLSDLVYHTGNEAISAPAGWVKFDQYYDPTTGYYGEAWGKLPTDASGTPIPGAYTEVIQVNRGTVFTDTGYSAPANVLGFTNSFGAAIPPAYLNANPGLQADSNATSDNSLTVSADVSIVFGEKPSYMASADAFYQQIEAELSAQNLNIPIIETGQSLGGATADSVVADNYAPGVNISAITFNALPYGEGIAGLSTSLSNVITNYYVGNELLSQSLLGRAFQWLTGGTPLGSSVQLPPLPDDLTGSVGDQNIIKIHDAPAGVSQLFQYLYPNSTAPSYAAGLALLETSYPNFTQGNSNTNPDTSQTYTPTQIYDLLAGITVQDSSNGSQAVVVNINDSVSIATGGNGSLTTAQQIETVSQSQSEADDTYRVISIPANANNNEVEVWETDAYNSASQLVGIMQSKVYTDGSFAVYTYSPARVLQSICTAEASGDQLVQTYSASGDINTSVEYTTNNTLIVQQFQGDPTLISNSTIDIGTASVTGIVEDSDQSVLTELNYGATSSNTGTYVGLVDNSDGSAALVDGKGETGTAGDIINFGSGGLADDTLSITQATSGTIDVTLDIEPGAVTDISSDQSLSGVQDDFAFTGIGEAVQIGTISAFTGTISNFLAGDTIDLAGISATGATLGANNVLTVHESNGGTATLQLDPSQNFNNYSFDSGSDGSSGTDITITPIIYGPSAPAGGGAGGAAGFSINDASISKVTTTGTESTVTTHAATYAGTASAFDSATSTLYLEQQQSSGGMDVVSFNVANGSFSDLGAVPKAFDVYTFESATNSLFGLGGIAGGGIESDGFIVSASGFYSYDVTTKSESLAIADSATFIANAFAVDGSTGLAYLEEVESNGVHLLSVNPSTNAVQDIALLAVPLQNFVFDRTTNEVFGVASSGGGGLAGTGPFFSAKGFYTINPTTGSETLVQSNSSSFVVSDFVMGANDTMYLEELSGNTPHLVAVSTVTGAVTDEGALTSSFTSLAAAQDGVTCFVSGTRIATEIGEVCVQDFVVGDLVRTISNRFVPIKWIGHRRLGCSRHPEPRKVWPVCVRAGAFGEGMPYRDLWLSPDHAVFVDGVLIPIKHLINGCTIKQKPRAEVIYYHIELEQHDVLFAEGLPVESYLDTGDRSKFANGGDIVQLFPEFTCRSSAVTALWEAKGCAPLIVTGPYLRTVQRRLNARIGHPTAGGNHFGGRREPRYFTRREARR
jgi:hypothetical protein